LVAFNYDPVIDTDSRQLAVRGDMWWSLWSCTRHCMGHQWWVSAFRQFRSNNSASCSLGFCTWPVRGNTFCHIFFALHQFTDNVWFSTI